MIPQNILFIAEGQLGDLLILTPALRAVKESFPHSTTSVLVVERRTADESKERPFHDLTASPFEREASVLSSNNNVDELLVVNRQALRALRGIARISAELSIVSFLRRKKFDTIVCTFPEDRFTLWAFASGANVRVGQLKQGLHWLLTHTCDIQKKSSGVLEYYCNLVRAIGATVQSMQTEYIIPEFSKTLANELFRSRHISATETVIAIHPGASADLRIWPPEYFAALITHLAETTGVKVLLVGGRSDKSVLNAITQRVHSSIIEIETGTNVGVLAAILQRCKLCISNDSGPRHLAIAIGVKSIALFRQHPEIWQEWNVYPENDSIAAMRSSGQCPVCPPEMCLDKTPDGERYGSHCLRMISVEDVVRQVEKMLG